VVRLAQPLRQLPGPVVVHIEEHGDALARDTVTNHGLPKRVSPEVAHRLQPIVILTVCPEGKGAGQLAGARQLLAVPSSFPAETAGHR
jgi:hypothetical protein